MHGSKAAFPFSLDDDASLMQHATSTEHLQGNYYGRAAGDKITTPFEAFQVVHISCLSRLDWHVAATLDLRQPIGSMLRTHNPLLSNACRANYCVGGSYHMHLFSKTHVEIASRTFEKH